MNRSWGADTFDRLYSASNDPWQFRTSAYERQKYAATLAALPPGRFAAAFEAGCSIGVLTRDLADRCDFVLAVDISEAALRLAADRCADRNNVDFVRMMLPRDWPADRRFDLMLFSEVLYFLDAPDVRLVARRASETLAAHGSVLLVNWTGDTDTPTTGDTAADAFIAASGLAVTRQSRAPGYRLDLLRR